jgi:aminocarboxymuconate-semialdehyde decarboxylase
MHDLFNNSIKLAKSIDVHAHAVLDQSMGTAGEHGPELIETEDQPSLFRVGGYELHGVKYRDSAFMDVGKRIARMSTAGIDFQILSPNPLTYFNYIDAPSAINFCKRHNDSLIDLVKQHPDKLAGFAALPMQDIPAACEELRRSVTELGLLAAYIGTDIGQPLDGTALDPLYGTCLELNVPLFIHPAPAGIDGPPGDPLLNRFDLALTTGFAASETIAVSSIIFGEVLERHPGLDICVSHGGGAVPYLVGRLAQASRVRAWAPESLRKDGAFEEMLARLWFDSNVHDPRSFGLLADVVGTDRLVLGTNFAGWDQAEIHHSPEFLMLMADNARRLLRVAP